MKVRKGITLVELLIVIVIIGILASVIMLSGGYATASAEASRIISDLRTLKAAALALYAESTDVVIANFAPNSVGSLALLQVYLSNPDRFIAPDGPYEFFQTDVAGVGIKWWVVYDLTRSSMVKEVSDKLASRADSVGLFYAFNGGTVFQSFRPGDMRAHMVVR